MKPYREEGEGSKREKDRDRVIGVYLVGSKNSPAAARRSPANFLGPLAGWSAIPDGFSSIYISGRVYNREQPRARVHCIDREREGAHASSASCPCSPPYFVPGDLYRGV